MSVQETENLFELLQKLSPREQATLRPVLERDLEFQRIEKARIQRLKKIANLSSQTSMTANNCEKKYGTSEEDSKNSALVSEHPNSSSTKSGRVCFYCHCPLGIIFNAGKRCSKCTRLLCENCRRVTTGSKSICRDCHIQRELLAASGEWVNDGGATDISSLLLNQMRQAVMDKREENRKYFAEHDNFPEMSEPETPPPSLPRKSSNSEKQAKNSSTKNPPHNKLKHEQTTKSSTDHQLSNQRIEKFPSKRHLKLPSNNLLRVSSGKVPAWSVEPKEASTTNLHKLLYFLQHLEVYTFLNTQEAWELMSNSAILRGKRYLNKVKTATKSEPSTSFHDDIAHSRLDDDQCITQPSASIHKKNSGNLNKDIYGEMKNHDIGGNNLLASSTKSRSIGNLEITSLSSTDSLSTASSTTDISNDYNEKHGTTLEGTDSISNLGQIQLAINYNINSACLVVKILQCKALPYFGSQKPNPYVKVVLVPFHVGGPVLWKKTAARKSDTNPIFDQILEFTRITKIEVDEYRMVVSVWHRDLISQNSLIGEKASLQQKMDGFTKERATSEVTTKVVTRSDRDDRKTETKLSKLKDHARAQA
ncbi:C2 domain protein [Dictyocaulus viviparus]|uniref:C2 domain protein n=1 Tax=Dictyocaulus viviparus TaxID=29172 RepID=A0A0D8Y6K2_DICVI|nr:C2 domain protein [Dictyocaulus viviparus]